MSKAFSRRDFLKATAAAALAVSLSGALTGCGEDPIPSATIGLGEFEVTVTGNMTLTGDEVVGSESENQKAYLFKPNVTIKYNGRGFAGTTFKGTFAGRIDKENLKLNNGEKVIAGANASFARSQTYVPELSASASAYNAFKKGTPFKLRVTLQGSTAEFTLTSSGNVTVAAVPKE